MQDIINAELLKYEMMDAPEVAPSTNLTVIEVLCNKRALERIGNTSVLEVCYEHLLSECTEISKLDPATQINRLSVYLEGLHNNLPLIMYWDNILSLGNVIEELIYLRKLYNQHDKWIDLNASALGMEQNRIYDIINNEDDVRRLGLLRDKKTTPEYYNYCRALYRQRRLELMA